MIIMADICSIIGKKIITKDAFEFGTVTDLRCENVSWKVVGLKVKLGSSVSSDYKSLSSKTALLGPDDFVINDYMLTNKTRNSIRSKVTADDKSIQSISELKGIKVHTSDALLLGTVSSVAVDTSKWEIDSITVKLDKDAYDALDIKRSLKSRKGYGIKMSDIKGVSDTVVISVDSKEVKSRLISP